MNTKYRKVEIKAKMIIQDSIHKHLVAYISEPKASKDMYDKLVIMFRVSNDNQILFFKNQLNNIKKVRMNLFIPILWGSLKLGITS